MSKLQGTLELNSYFSCVAYEEMQPTETKDMTESSHSHRAQSSEGSLAVLFSHEIMLRPEWEEPVASLYSFFLRLEAASDPADITSYCLGIWPGVSSD